MRAVVAWQETPPEKDGVRSVCYDLCFKPDGTQLVAGVGARVLIYDAGDGELLHVLKGHKDAVYAVAYASNGKRFASGGADKTVIIWTSKAEGILKYTHADSIQCLAYNPVTQQLASGTASDVGLWSPEAKSVAKHKVPAKVLCMAWTGDGMLLALGLFDGSVSLRDRAGSEKQRFTASSSPVWSLAWSPGDQAQLVVGCLDGLLKFFTSTGQPKHKERTLDGDPLSLAFLNADCLLVGGSDKCVHLLTREGVYLTRAAAREAWVWAIAARPRANALALGCEDGSLAVVSLVFATVHGLYGERYVYRDLMCDVIIQHLLTEQKVRIKCRDYVKKVAIYRDRVAVQLPSRIVIYALEPPPGPADAAAGAAPAAAAPSPAAGNDSSMQYRAAAKINQKLDCNLLVVTSQHIVLCQEKRLQLYGFDGCLVREWLLDAAVRYIRVAGGPPGREGLLLGLKSGAVLKIYVDNAFAMPLVKHGAGVRCLDLNVSRRKLAVVDEANSVAVYDLTTKELLFTEAGANSVAWNSASDDTLAFSGSGQLVIRTGDLPLHSQKLSGFVVGFKGSKVFCLQYSAMATIDVPQSSCMAAYLARGDLARAHAIACLGVTEGDWRGLALAALQALGPEVARAAFIRLRDVRSMELVDRVAAGLASGTPRGLLLAEVAAWQGSFDDAARLYVSEGHLDKAIELFTSLRMFEAARQVAEQAAASGQLRGGGGSAAAVAELIGRQAEWSEETANYEAAAEMFIKARQYERAILLLERHGWWERLLALMRALDAAAEPKALAAAVAAFRRAGRSEAAKEGLLKLGDVAGLLALHVGERRWDDAFLLLSGRDELAGDVYLPYAQWLLQQDRFSEACAAYARGGRPDLGRAILQQLADAAVAQRRFADAAHGHYQLAMQALQGVCNPPGALTDADREALRRFGAHYDTAELYCAYSVIHDTAAAPFKTADDATLFNAARFLLMRLPRGEQPPRGISLAQVLLALAGLARAQGAFKLARFAYGRLQALVLPPAVAAEVELAALMLRAQPFTDADALLPVCYRCQATNTLVNTQGDFCTSCGAPFLRSFCTFEVLPLVEFELEPGISEAEALSLLGEDALGAAAGTGGGGQQLGANVLRLDRDGDAPPGDDNSAAPDDVFAAQAAVPHSPIVLGRAALRRLRPGEVLQRRWPNACLPAQWFRLLDEEQPVVVGPCGHFFEADEYEMSLLEHGMAPFSREPLEQEGGGWQQPAPSQPQSAPRQPQRAASLQRGASGSQSQHAGLSSTGSAAPAWPSLGGGGA